MNKNLWKKFLAGVSAAVMLVASLGAMPIVSAEGIEIEPTTLIPQITFNNLSDYEDTTNPETVEIEAWSNDNVVFKKGKTASTGGTYTAKLDKIDEVDKYLAGVYTDNGAGTKTSSAIYVYGSDGKSIANSSVVAGNQIVYEFSTHSGKTLNMYTQTQGKRKKLSNGSYANWYASSNYLFNIDGGKLYLGTGMNDTSDKVKKDGLGYINLPKDQWVDIRIVYTIYDDGTNDFEGDAKFKTSVAAYVNGKIYFPKKLDNKGYTTDNGETWLPLNVWIEGTYEINKENIEGPRCDNVTPFHTRNIERVTIMGSADMALDNFAITKYSGKMYDVADAERGDSTTLLPTVDFNTWDAAAATTASTSEYTDTTTGIKFNTTNKTGTVTAVEDATGDMSLKTDISNFGVTGPAKTVYPGMFAGDQLVFSADIHTGTVGNWKAVTGGSYESEDRPRAWINYFGIKNASTGVFVLYNGGAYNDDYNKDTAPDYPDYSTHKSQEEVGVVDVPFNKWIHVDVVYTAYEKGDGSKGLKASLYVNGYLQNFRIGETDLGTEVEIAHPDFICSDVKRYELDRGHWDNISATGYMHGAQFNPSTLTKTGGVVTEHTDSTNLKYTALEYLVGSSTMYERSDQTLDADLDGVYGKIAEDKVINIAYDTRTTMPGNYDKTEDVTEDGYTFEKIYKRLTLIDRMRYAKTENAMPISISFDILAKDASDFVRASMSGRVINDDGAYHKGTVVMELVSSADGIVVQYNDGGNDTQNHMADVESIDPIGYKEWHNVTMQFTPGEAKFKLYIDGDMTEIDVPKYKGTTKFNGFGNLYLEFRGSALIDNIVLRTCDYTPVAPADVELAVAEDAKFGRGNVWDGSKLVTNKSALAYTADIAAAFSSEGNTVVLLDANGAVATEGGTIDQIAVRGADGFIHYWKVAKRTTTGLRPEGDGKYYLDVADNSGYKAENVLMFVVTYDNENNTIESVDVNTPSSAAGDTLFFDGVEVPEGAKIMVFHNGTLAPLAPLD